MEITKTFTLRLLFTPEQANKAKQHADAKRACYNWALAMSMKEYKETGKRPTRAEIGRRLTALKNTEDVQWWMKISRMALTQAIIDLNQAYKRFFRVQKEGVKFTEKVKRKAARQKRKLTTYDMKGHPKFKKRKNDRLGFYGCAIENLRIRKNTVNLACIGRVPFRASQEIPEGAKLSNPRVVYINGKWLLRLGITFQQQQIELNDYKMGIDVGIDNLAVISFNNQEIAFKHVNKKKRVRSLERRIKHLQRELSRRERGSKRYEKTRLKLTEKHFHLSQIRRDHIHKVTRTIVNLKPKKIVLETLNISGMMKNRHLARSIQNAMLYETQRQIRYKSKWQQTEIEDADMFYPSSKLCSECGSYKKNLKLSDRVYRCDNCGFVKDRDANAARNLSQYTGKS
jgi:putative transposase